jgi:aminobenzoyl-glutamate utilization protein B
MHYVIQSGGQVPNVVPEYAKVWMWVRDSKREGIDVVFERVKEIAQGAALMSGTEAKVTVQAGDYEILVNMKGAEAMQKNLDILGPIVYTPEEEKFASELQKNAQTKNFGFNSGVTALRPTKPDPEGGSSDVGDVSWNVPEIGLVVSTAPKEIPWHSWAVVACGGMSIGHKGMLYAAKAMGMTMVDLFENETLRKEIRTEFEQRKGNHVYKPYIPDGPPPIPSGK